MMTSSIGDAPANDRVRRQEKRRGQETEAGVRRRIPSPWTARHPQLREIVCCSVDVAVRPVPRDSSVLDPTLWGSPALDSRVLVARPPVKLRATLGERQINSTGTGKMPRTGSRSVRRISRAGRPAPLEEHNTHRRSPQFSRLVELHSRVAALVHGGQKKSPVRSPSKAREQDFLSPTWATRTRLLTNFFRSRSRPFPRPFPRLFQPGSSQPGSSLALAWS